MKRRLIKYGERLNNWIEKKKRGKVYKRYKLTSYLCENTFVTIGIHNIVCYI